MDPTKNKMIQPFYYQPLEAIDKSYTVPVNDQIQGNFNTNFKNYIQNKEHQDGSTFLNPN